MAGMGLDFNPGNSGTWGKVQSSRRADYSLRAGFEFPRWQSDDGTLGIVDGPALGIEREVSEVVPVKIIDHDGGDGSLRQGVD